MTMRSAAPLVALGASAIVLGMAALGCSDDTEPAASTTQPEPDAGAGGEPSVDAGPSCPPGTEEQGDGSCLGAGVPPEGCAEGFEPDGAEGCEPILPDAPCTGPGQVAYLGEQSCHDIAPCGTGDWGDIPVDSTTQYVDDSYTAPDADGTADKPWPTVQQGVDAAAPDAIVAIAEGFYPEEVIITSPVQLWGRCPVLVTLEGTAAPTVTLDGPGASGTVLRGLGVTSADHGISVRGATQVLVTQLWLHDIAHHALRAGKHESPTELTIQQVLVDRLGQSNLLFFGAEATLEQVVARGSADNQDSRGIEVQDDLDNLRRSQVTLRSSILEDHGWANAYVIGSDVTIEGSLIRDTAGPELFGSTYGFGVHSHGRNETGELPTVTIRGTVVDRPHRMGVFLGGASATVENVTIRAPRPNAELAYGRGLVADRDFYPPFAPAQVEVRGTLIEGATDIGAMAWESELTLERTVIRGTQPSPDGQLGGVGAYGFAGQLGAQSARLALSSSVVADSHSAGVVAIGTDLSLDRVVITTTAVQPGDGTMGDGIVMAHQYPFATSAELTSTEIRDSERAGIASFGSPVTLSSLVLACNTIHINGEVTLIKDFNFADLGGNWCGCGSDEVLCQVLSSALMAPSPVEDPGGI